MRDRIFRIIEPVAFIVLTIVALWIGDGFWELYLLIIVSWVACRMFASRKWYFILASLPLIYLVTNLFWPVLNAHHDINNAGPTDWWIFNCWNAVFDWPPGMKWWMWLLFLIGCLMAFLDWPVWTAASTAQRSEPLRITRHARLLDIERLCIGIAVVIGIANADWGDGLYHLFGTPADTKPVVRLESMKCDDLKAKFKSDLKTEADVNAEQTDSQSQTQDQKDKLELDAKNAAEAVDADRKALLARTDCPIEQPSAQLSAVVRDKRQPLVVSFDATKSSGYGLTYQVITGDPNFADAVETGTQLPDGVVVTDGKSFNFGYTLAGQYDPTLVVTDALGRTSASTKHLDLK